MTQAVDSNHDRRAGRADHHVRWTAGAGRGKSPADYDKLHARMSQALKPSNVIKQISIRDVVDLVWEVFRLRRPTANLMAAATYEGMRQILEPLLDSPEWYAKHSARRDESAVQTVEAALAKAGRR